MAIKAQVSVAVIQDHQQAGTAQPVGKHHAPAMYGVHLATGGGADHHAVPFGASVVAAGFTEARK